MTKNKEPDNLALDMIQCKKDGFGCHYGAWKALQGKPLREKPTDKIPEGWKVCPQCGKAFKANKMNRRQIYCEIGCQKRAQAEKDREKIKEYRKIYRERKRKELENESCA